MSDLGKFGASAAEFFSNPMLYNDKITTAHRIDIAGVASSILGHSYHQKPRQFGSAELFYSHCIAHPIAIDVSITCGISGQAFPWMDSPLEQPYVREAL